jgi:hypothetical protein
MLGSIATTNTNQCTTIWSKNKTFSLEHHLQQAATKKATATGHNNNNNNSRTQQQPHSATTNIFQLV